jgi:branched-chain amino acid transport system substrate-binding protein
MRKKTVLVIAVSLLTMLALTFSMLPVRGKTTVLIGWSIPATGPVSGTAAVHHLYYKMIIDYYNTHYHGLYVPGYGNLTITYDARDDGYEIPPFLPGTMIKNYHDLIAEGCDLLFAPWSTAFCVKFCAEFDKDPSLPNPIVGLTVGSNTLQDYLTNGTWTHLFVTLGQPREDAVEVVNLFKYINTQVAPSLQINKVGMAYRADEHGIEHYQAISDGLVAAGFTVVVLGSGAYIPPDMGGTPDWHAIITNFKTAGCDAVIVCSYAEGADFVHQCMLEIPPYNPKLVMVGPAMETPFLVYGPFGFTEASAAGIAYYNGWPATGFITPDLRAWRDAHLAYAGYLPFPASAVFYAGVQSLFDAVGEHGLDREALTTALKTETFSTIVGNFNFRTGLSPLVANHGTLTQWQGRNMMDVIWHGGWEPPANSTDYIIYPKFPWDYPTNLDINKDEFVDIWDIARAAKAFGAWPGHERWYEKADINQDEIIDILDIATIAKAFGAAADVGGTIPVPVVTVPPYH